MAAATRKSTLSSYTLCGMHCTYLEVRYWSFIVTGSKPWNSLPHLKDCSSSEWHLFTTTSPKGSLGWAMHAGTLWTLLGHCASHWTAEKFLVCFNQNITLGWVIPGLIQTVKIGLLKCCRGSRPQAALGCLPDRKITYRYSPPPTLHLSLQDPLIPVLSLCTIRYGMIR